MPNRKLAALMGLWLAGLCLAGCQTDTVTIPALYTLAPTLTPVSASDVLRTQVSASQTAVKPTPVPPTATLTPAPNGTATAVPSTTPTATPMPTFTPVPPTATSLPSPTSTFTALPPTSTFTALPPTSTFTAVPPTLTPTPAVTAGFTPANLLTNPSFEGGWTLSATSAQMPNGWQYYSPAHGATLPFPTKMQSGNVVPALADDYAESQHFTSDQLPPEERLGQSRGLILDGNTVLRVHGAWRACAVVLRQQITAPPGALVRITGYILAESLSPPNAQGLKEPDGLVAALHLYGAAGLAEDKRILVNMETRNDVPTSSRHWDRLEVTAPAPASGQMTVEIIVQQNWGGSSEWFFLDNFSSAIRQ